MEGIVWLALCFGVGYLANKKGRSGIGWGIASLILSPLICGIIVALLKDNKQTEDITKINMEHQTLQDRVAADEIKNNQQFQKIESTLNSLQSSENKTLLSSANNASTLLETGMKKCPYCGESIKENAVKCRYCGAAIEQVEMKECPFCKELIRADAVKCKFCRSDLNKAVSVETSEVEQADFNNSVINSKSDEVKKDKKPDTEEIADMKLQKCPNCQAKVSLSAKYCDNCGHKL